MNGTLIASGVVSHQRLFALTWSEDGQCLVVGGAGRVVLVVHAHSLKVILKVGAKGASLRLYDERRFAAMGIPAQDMSGPSHQRPKHGSPDRSGTGTGHRHTRGISGSSSSAARSSKATLRGKQRHRRDRSSASGAGSGAGAGSGSASHLDDVVKLFPHPVTSIVLTRHEREMVVGLADGTVAIFAPEALYYLGQVAGRLIGIGF